MAFSAKPESGGENYDIIFLSSPSFRKACPEIGKYPDFVPQSKGGGWKHN